MRVVIAEDLALLREGLVALLRENDIEVVAQVQDGAGLLRAIAGHKPDLAIVDVRLPPTFSDEGLRAAIEARRRQPQLPSFSLSTPTNLSWCITGAISPNSWRARSSHC